MEILNDKPEALVKRRRRLFLYMNLFWIRRSAKLGRPAKKFVNERNRE